MDNFPLNKLKDLLDENKLDLSAHGLKAVPTALMQLPKATDIDLSGNKLHSLPEELCNMTRIVRLDLGNNAIALLPHNFGNLVNLQYLNLYNNQIEELPLSFANLRSLKWLDLGRNDLKPELQKVIGDCNNDKECKEAAVKAVSRQQQRQAELNRKVQENKLVIEQARKSEKKDNEKKKKTKKETVEQPINYEKMVKHHKQHSKRQEATNENEEVPRRGLTCCLFSLTKFLFKWTFIVGLCFTLCATIALSTDCYNTGGTIPLSKSFCTDLRKIGNFKAPSDRFVQNARNAYSSVFNNYQNQVGRLAANTKKTANEYYKKATFMKDAENFLYKAYTSIVSYFFYAISKISEAYSTLVKWYEADGKASIGFVVEPVKVGSRMIYEALKDLFFYVSASLGKFISHMTVFFEKLFNVWAEKGFSAAIDAAFQH